MRNSWPNLAAELSDIENGFVTAKSQLRQLIKLLQSQ